MVPQGIASPAETTAGTRPTGPAVVCSPPKERRPAHDIVHSSPRRIARGRQPPCSPCPALADTQTGFAIRAGTLGLGADFEVSFNQYLNARVGFAGYSTDRTVNQTDVTYDGKLKLSNPSALLDWRVFGGGFRVSVGAVVSGTKVDAVGRPDVNGNFQIGNNTYTSSQIGSLNGTFKFGNSVAPYIGFGWGNVVGNEGHFSVLFDVGAIYAGTPNVTLTANCTAGVQEVCAQLQTDVDTEKQKLEQNLTLLKWYPVVGLGFGYRF